MTTQSLEKNIQEKFNTAFEKCGFDTTFALIKNSDRPDLSDLQCNGALALAKTLHKNPREIALSICEQLQDDPDIEALSIDGPGFINIRLKNGLIAQKLNEMLADKRLGCQAVENPKRIVMDFGGPNVAKALHVGHLRSAVVGESLRRIESFIGNVVISDVHFGDWGTPMGMILAEIIRHDGDLSKVETYNINEISQFYKNANIRCKEDENTKEKARLATTKIQNGEKEYYQAWQYIRRISIEDVRKNYDILDAHFDLWLGESDAHQTCGEIVKIAGQKNISVKDDGATIIRLAETNKPMPPVILVKSDGGFGYQLTDIATIKMRVDDQKAQEIIYVVDKRQTLHFEQVFEVAEMLGIAPNVELKHIGFGTVNGADGKPFKTRDGGVMNLSDLIEMSKNKVRESLPKPGEVEGYGEKEIETLVTQIALAAIKFQDLKNNIGSGYVFNLEDFAKFDGKTGPYIQYAVARINSLIRKANEKGLCETDIEISAPDERDLALKLTQFENTLIRAHQEKEPSIIADYAYTLAQTFSSFYNTCPILTAQDSKTAGSRLKLARLVLETLKLNLYLLGIEAPEVMLKASN